MASAVVFMVYINTELYLGWGGWMKLPLYFGSSDPISVTEIYISFIPFLIVLGYLARQQNLSKTSSAHKGRN